MRVPLFFILFLVCVSFGEENCLKEDIIPRINSILERNYLWWDKLKGMSWKDEKELIERIRSIGDRWTSIINQKEEGLWYSSSKMIGIGIRWDDKGYVKKVFPHSPAERDGIKEGDLIVAINGISDKKLWRKAIKDSGDYVEIDLIRNGFFITLWVKKGEFTVPVIEDLKVVFHDEKKVGYIKLSNFTQPAKEAFKEAMDFLKSENIDILILDLRDNGGGLISVAKSIADMLIGGEGVMFYLEGRDRNFGVYQFKNKKGFEKPIVVLVNRQTASAAELLTTLLKRYANALVIGENTVGKYVGSNMYPIDSCGNMLKLVTFEMKLPSGERIAKDGGIEPDCKLEEGDFIGMSIECLSSSLLATPAINP